MHRAIETGEKYRKEHYPDFESVIITPDPEPALFANPADTSVLPLIAQDDNGDAHCRAGTIVEAFLRNLGCNAEDPLDEMMIGQAGAFFESGSESRSFQNAWRTSIFPAWLENMRSGPPHIFISHVPASFVRLETPGHAEIDITEA